MLKLLKKIDIRHIYVEIIENNRHTSYLCRLDRHQLKLCRNY